MAFVMRHTATGAVALISSLLLSATGAAGTAPVDASFSPGASLPAGPTPSTPGLCNVQQVADLTLAAAKRVLASVNCRAGKVTYAHTTRVKKGRIANYSPKFGAVLPGGGKVNLVVSLGPKKRHS